MFVEGMSDPKEEPETEVQGEGEAAEPPPADFDPAENPSNPDLVKDTESPE